MQYRTDDRSGQALSILGFGCMRFPRTLGQVDTAKTEKLILKAYAQGINFFDTGYIYPGSEEVLGDILSKHQLREKIYLATKLPMGKCKTYEDFDRFLGIQLERLKTHYIDYYFIHNLPNLATWNRLKDLGIERWIAEKKASGIIRRIGFSFHGMRSEFVGLLDDYDWDVCLIQYNYVNENHQAGREGLQEAGRRGIPVVIMEPLLGGRLATGLPAKAREVFKKADPKATPVQWGLRWLWNQPEVTVVLSGMNSESQLDENLSIANVSSPGMMTDAEHRAIATVVDIFGQAYKVPCTGCNYCMPCPHHVNISGAFSAYNAYHAVSRFTGIQQYLTSVASATPEKDHSPSLCVKCGKCEKQCPQHIAIMDELETVKKTMEPFWVGTLKKIVRRMGS